MINDTTAGRWLKRVIWLGIFANLALELPTIAAPDMLIEFSRLPTATPVLVPMSSCRCLRSTWTVVFRPRKCRVR